MVSVAFMNGETLQRRPNSRNNRRVQTRLARLPEVFTSRLRPELVACKHSAISVSQPTSPTSSPNVTSRLQENPSPCASTNASSPPSLPPLQLLFLRDAQLVVRKHCVKNRRNSHFAINGSHFAQSISPSHEGGYSRYSSMQTAGPASEEKYAQLELSKRHLRASFPRNVFGGLSGRKRWTSNIS